MMMNGRFDTVISRVPALRPFRPRCGMSLQGLRRLIEAYRGAAGLCFAKMLPREITDTREIVHRWLRPTKVH